MLESIRALRGFSGKAAVALLAGLMLSVAACGSSSTAATATPTSNPLTACKVTNSDLALPGSGSATATAVASISGQTLAIDGSTALAPLFSDAAKSFDTVNSTHTSVTPNGSGAGLNDAESGAVQIGLSDFFAKERASASNPTQFDNLVDHEVAAVAFSLVVSSDLSGKVSNLTTSQIQQIYTGSITNWSQVGGPNEAVTVINRTATSGTRFTFKKYVLAGQTENAANSQTQDTSAQVATAVGAAQGAIAYVSNGFVVSTSALTPVCIDGYGGTAANINAGKYNFWAFEHAYTKGTPTAAAQAMLDFVNTTDFQTKDLPSLAFLQVSSLSATAKASHPAP
jgi:phosphate transport system substrate-binding protein